MSDTRPRRTPLDSRGLRERVDIFRVTAGIKDDPAVELWLADGQSKLRRLARTWFERTRECGRDVVELMHDGCPVASIGDAPFAYVNAFKAHVNVGFFYGAMLEDPAGLLEGSGKRMRHVTLRLGAEFDSNALGKLIQTAYGDLRERLAAEPSPH